jgi:hypothetical protein
MPELMQSTCQPGAHFVDRNKHRRFNELNAWQLGRRGQISRPEVARFNQTGGFRPMVARSDFAGNLLIFILFLPGWIARPPPEVVLCNQGLRGIVEVVFDSKGVTGNVFKNV